MLLLRLLPDVARLPTPVRAAGGRGCRRERVRRAITGAAAALRPQAVSAPSITAIRLAAPHSRAADPAVDGGAGRSFGLLLLQSLLLGYALGPPVWHAAMASCTALLRRVQSDLASTPADSPHAPTLHRDLEQLRTIMYTCMCMHAAYSYSRDMALQAIEAVPAADESIGSVTAVPPPCRPSKATMDALLHIHKWSLETHPPSLACSPTLELCSVPASLSPSQSRHPRIPPLPPCPPPPVMSLDVTSYWQAAALTPNGLIRYEHDEVALYCTRTPHVDVECGGEGLKHTFKAGYAHVTSHRIVWVRDRQAGAASAASSSSSSPLTAAAVYLPLDAIERVEQKSLMLSLGFGTPKLTLHLHDPNMLAYIRRQQAAGASAASSSASSLAAAAAASSAAAEVPPARSTLPRFARLCFRNEAPNSFLQHLQSSLSAGVWRHAPPSSVSLGGASVPSSLAAPGSEFTTSHAGISGIERVAKKRERAIDRTLEQAFQDLDALMANAKQVVQLSTKLAQQQQQQSARGDGQSDQSQSELQSILSDMGIANPVTRQLAGSDYHMQLSRQMADYLPPIMDKQGGMLLLTDVYCVVNRARGTQLISPLDCLTACQLFPQLPATTLRLKEFESGVKAVVADARTETKIADKILAELQQEEEEKGKAGAASFPPQSYASMSPLRLSNLWHISIVLAKQYLCVAEQLQVLCRDESTHGLAFNINHFGRFVL